MLPAALNQRVACLRIKTDRITKEFLFHILNNDFFEQQCIQASNGVAQKNISTEWLKDYEIPLYTIEEQLKISAVLDKIRHIIMLRNNELRALDELIRARFIELFVETDEASEWSYHTIADVSNDMRTGPFGSALHHDEFVDSGVFLDDLIKARFIELFGDPVSNSYDLPEATLPDLGKFGRGVSKHRPRNDIKLLGGKYPLIQTGDVANAGLYITSYSNTYSELGLKQSKMWDKGTLCITIAANIAKTAILEFDACFPDSVVGFTANERTNNIFIHYWFSFFQAILESQAPESAQKNINLKILSELKVIVPEKKKQDEFASFVEATDKSKVAVQKALDETQLLFDSLMQEYFG